LTIFNNWACATNKITLFASSLGEKFRWYCSTHAKTKLQLYYSHPQRI